MLRERGLRPNLLAWLTPTVLLFQSISSSAFLGPRVLNRFCWKKISYKTIAQLGHVLENRLTSSLLLPFAFLFLAHGIVVACWPAWIFLHVKLTLFPSLVVVFCLLLPTEAVPLKRKQRSHEGQVRLFTNMTGYPAPEDLVDGSWFLQRAFSYNLGPHLLHVEHESIQRLFNVDPIILLSQPEIKITIYTCVFEGDKPVYLAARRVVVLPECDDEPEGVVVVDDMMGEPEVVSKPEPSKGE